MIKAAKFSIGQVVRHKVYLPVAVRPKKDQPFYHLYAENDETVYEAYVSEQNLLIDDSITPLRHPSIAVEFKRGANGTYSPLHIATH